MLMAGPGHPGSLGVWLSASSARCTLSYYRRIEIIIDIHQLSVVYYTSSYHNFQLPHIIVSLLVQDSMAMSLHTLVSTSMKSEESQADSLDLSS